MQIFERSSVIDELLNRLDIPRVSFRSSPEPGIGPCEPGYFLKEKTRRKEQEAAAKIKLDGLGDVELLELSESPEALDGFARDCRLLEEPAWYSGGFNIGHRKPDYEYWAELDYWTLEEATCLSIGFKPEKMPVENPEIPGPRGPIDFYWERLEVVKRASIWIGREDGKIEPNVFLKWVINKKFEIPQEMSRLSGSEAPNERPAMLENVDARLHDSALKVILGLLAVNYYLQLGIKDNEAGKDIATGLADLGLSLDRKTIKSVLMKVIKSKNRFLEEQSKRDT